jgi:hypothetical protein
MVGMMVGGSVGSGVNDTVGSGVLLGLAVEDGVGVSEGIAVAVAAERPGTPQPVIRESRSRKAKMRMRFKESPEVSGDLKRTQANMETRRSVHQ